MTNKGVTFLAKALGKSFISFITRVLTHLLCLFIGVSSNIVPATFKAKKAAIAAPKVEGDEKVEPAASGEAGEAEAGETPGMGRGAR